MSNIPGATNVLPGVFTDVITQSRGVAIPGGSRIAAVLGEGSADETVIIQAQGGGKDGLNPSYTSATGADGRHFQLSNAPFISNRTSLYKDGVLLIGYESLIDSNPFSDTYDYRIDINSGRVELQRAHLIDQGGLNYAPLSTNVGQGSLNALTLVDPNATPETWSIKCVGVQRNTMNQPMAGTAKFLALGSISGNKLDANGNPVIWVANGPVVSNGTISFSIVESVSAVFREGDAFTVKIASGVLVRNNSLTANYIPVANLNDPVIVQGMDDVVKRHGFPSLDNNLSLGCQLSFANQAPVLVTVQAAPAMPRRRSFLLTESFQALSTNIDDFIFPLPAGVTPDVNSNIHFFVTNNATNVETQLLPNKFAYYLLDEAGEPTTTQFVNSNTTYSYFYTVDQSFALAATGFDGYIARNSGFINQGLFSTPTITFDATYGTNTGLRLKVIDATNNSNIHTYVINGVVDGKLAVTTTPTTDFSDFTTDLSGAIAFQVIDPATGLAVTNGTGTDGSITAFLSSNGLGTLVSTSQVNFGSIPIIDTFKIKINGTATNDGLYDIVFGSASGGSINIQKAIVSESNMRYEIVDLNDVSNYIVLNKNIVPNGNALRVTIVDSKEASFYDAGWINALESLEAVECDIVVPLPKQTISVIFQNTLAHCKAMSNIRNKKERVMFAGAISGLTPDNLIGTKPAAVEDIGILEGIQGETIADVLAGNTEDLTNYSVPDAFGNTFRCVYFYPDQIVVQAGSDNVLIDGFYIAAAAAGYESADPRVENPLTNKVLSGFTILRNKLFSRATLESLALAGVTTLQPVAGGGRVVWGITTSQSGFAEEQEISIVFIRDRVAKTLRAGFEGFIGNPESPDTGAILNTRAVVLLNALTSQGLITNFKDLAVARDTVDPRQWNISVRVQPTYPVNFIYIKVSLGQL